MTGHATFAKLVRFRGTEMCFNLVSQKKEFLMADVQPNFTPEFVLTFRDMMLHVI